MGTPECFVILPCYVTSDFGLDAVHTSLNSVNVISVSSAILINRKRISVYQALFLRAGYQAIPDYKTKF